MTVLTFHTTPAPDWIVAFFGELDAKTYGAGLNVLAEDAEARLGVHRWQGREVIRERLRASGTDVDTRHVVQEFWDGGPIKVLRGEIAITPHGTGQVLRSVISHFLFMDEHDPSKVRRWIGAFGPVE